MARFSIITISMSVIFLSCFSSVWSQDETERLFWETVDCDDDAQVRAYLETYPTGAFTNQAFECIRGQVEQSEDKPLAERLNTCRVHLEANRLTTGAGGNALACYQTVLEQDPDNTEALGGLNVITELYVARVRSDIQKNKTEKAQVNLEKLKKVNSEHPVIAELEDAIAKQVKRQPSEPEVVGADENIDKYEVTDPMPASQPCPVDMVYIPDGHYCIDRYEYPNRKGEVPEISLRPSRAANLCAELGKRLPTSREHTVACEGPNELIYSYGNAYSKNICFTFPGFSSEGQPSGAYPECVSGYGVYDMSGNVPEYTSDGGKRGMFHMQKKVYKCANSYSRGAMSSDPWFGFRCAKTAAGTPEQ